MTEIAGEPRLGPARVSESDGPIIEQKSKIKVTLNAKQDPQWEISVVEGVDPDELTRIRDLAVEQHRALQRELLGLS